MANSVVKASLAVDYIAIHALAKDVVSFENVERLNTLITAINIMMVSHQVKECPVEDLFKYFEDKYIPKE